MNVLNNYEIVLNYLIDNNYERYSCQSYKFFSIIIMNLTNDYSAYKSRKIFDILITLKYIKRVRKRTRFAYSFYNPYIRLNPLLFKVFF